MMMNVFEFKNTLNNDNKKPRCFVAFCASDAIKMAIEWADMVNETVSDAPRLMFTPDIESVNIIHTNHILTEEGYIELNDREIQSRRIPIR